MNLKDYRKFYFEPTLDITVYELAMVSRVPNALTGLIMAWQIPETCSRHFQISGEVYENKNTIDNKD